MIISLSGPSGIGKGFVKERLLQVYPYIEELTWITTRPLRPDEKHGNRIHVSITEFSQLVASYKLVLVQDLYGHRYGLKKEDLLPSQCVRLTELHPDNLLEAFKINPTILAIGFVTSNLLLLHKRLSVLRNTESAAEIEQRIAVAKIEIKTILRQKSLFAAVIEVTKASETLVFNHIIDKNIQTVHHQRAAGSNPVARFSFYLAKNLFLRLLLFMLFFKKVQKTRRERIFFQN